MATMVLPSAAVNQFASYFLASTEPEDPNPQGYRWLLGPLQPGTGGFPSIQTAEFDVARSPGYGLFVVISGLEPTIAEAPGPFSWLMKQVKAGFGRTMSRLPEVFGVSRQTLYNWLAGETPRDVHHAALRQLAAAAEVFSRSGFKLNSAMLDRPLSAGKSFLELMADGVDGAQTAELLRRTVARDLRQRAAVAEILGERDLPPLKATDIGSPHLREDE